ncbi:leucine-rich repeat receptor-like serine/threonine/tyrosine-protein kinase SOBIR1 [Trifolium pratense]|uniref:leucine-rich repeat receptor-like serine/threonine/tyrosine-protein kinase SOBIR1 n=1 Tax=Trifolium pratense TaxID=57577 RepID=UPI001E693B01|nr:leucine-rich repeat receptor-like serine/threonine/tyrosine-protein kinase SOBIR1 [Trifolium pratense]
MAKNNNFSFFFFFFLSFLSLLFSIHAKLQLHPSDTKALTTLQNNLGLNTTNPTNHPCNAEGVFCERRLNNNESYSLRVTKLVFKTKQLRGTLSSAIGKLSELKELSLSNNKLVDRIPPSIVDCRKLEILNLANNLFSGEVPSELPSLIRLRFLDISGNKLSGNLNFLRYFPNLETLSVADNHFTGRVPASVRSFRNLRQFNFSGNRFLEGVPVNQKLLEYQDTDNTVPKRYILAENSTSNPPRRNIHHSPAGAPAPGPAAAIHKNKKSRRKLAGWILGFIAGAFAGILSGFVFSLLFKLALALVKGKGKGSGPAIYSSLIKKAEDLAFLEKEDGLASLEIIGRGGCGEVYKAELPGSNGKMIAIKKIIQPPKDAADLAEEDSKILHTKMRQIKSEIDTVGQIRHRNLLPLLAHISRPDCHYLVYEFMKNGSLQDMLTNVERGEAELDWLSRHKIALGVAAGLEYLHTSHSPRIIHRDLKPANILLDDDMEARIADFGLAKAMPDAQTHISTSKVAGTVGYIAPEYHQIFKFSDKCDIYSFGVILGVLVMGKLPSDDFFQNTDEMSLVKWMRNTIISENPKDAIDARLIGNGFEEQMLLVLKIACFCTMDNPKERPDSKNVRIMLYQIKH